MLQLVSALLVQLVLQQVSQLVSVQVLLELPLPEQLALKMFELPLVPVAFHPLALHLLRQLMRRQMSKSLMVSMS